MPEPFGYSKLQVKHRYRKLATPSSFIFKIGVKLLIVTYPLAAEAFRRDLPTAERLEWRECRVRMCCCCLDSKMIYFRTFGFFNLPIGKTEANK